MVGIGIDYRYLPNPNVMLLMGLDNNIFAGYYIYYEGNGDFIDQPFSRGELGEGFSELGLRLGAYLLTGPNRQIHLGVVYVTSISRTDSFIYYTNADVPHRFLGLEIKYDFLPY